MVPLSFPMSRRFSCGLLSALVLSPARAATTDGAELRIGLAAPPTTLDPHFHADAANFGLQRHIFEALLQWDHDGQLQPLLARGWVPLASGHGWELMIDPAARFADGSPVTAEDAAASLHRAMTIPNSPSRYTPFLAGLQRVEVVGPEVLRLHTDKPAPLLPSGLTTILIIPARIAETASPADFNAGTAVVGSGPFRLRTYRQGEIAMLERNPNWWRAPDVPVPAWERVSLRIMTQDSARVAALLSGELDLIENVPPRDAPRLTGTPGLRLVRRPGTRVMFVTLNQEAVNQGAKAGHPLADQRVRRALSLALDREALVSQVMDGQAVAAGQLLPLDHVASIPGLLPAAADRAAARRLLREAGWGEGFSLPLMSTNNRFANDDQLVQALAQMWRQVGIEVEVEALPVAAFFPRYVSGQFTAALFGWPTGVGEPSGLFTTLLATRDRAGGRGAVNATGYGNPRLDSLIEAALVTPEATPRHALWRQAAQLAVVEDAALLPLFHQSSLWAMREGVSYDARADSLTMAADAHQAASR